MGMPTTLAISLTKTSQPGHYVFCCPIMVGYDQAPPEMQLHFLLLDRSDGDKSRANQVHYYSVLLKEVRLGSLTASGL